PVVNVFYRTGGVNSADAGGYSLGNGTTPTETGIATTSFSGISILKGAGTSLEVGAVLTTDTNGKGAKLSRIATTLTYTEAPSNLSATAPYSSRIDLTWTDN